MPTQDVDILVNAFYDWDAESIKVAIVRADDRYYLERSKLRKATHKILRCRLPGWHLDRRSVKVDILVPPGELEFPEIDSSETPTINGIPRHAALRPPRHEAAGLVAPPHFGARGLPRKGRRRRDRHRRPPRARHRRSHLVL